jgi:hypothetical protein
MCQQSRNWTHGSAIIPIYSIMKGGRMIVYIAIKEGVYRHEIVGVYDDVNKAIERAKELCDAEPDDYHNFDIGECTLNTPIGDVEIVQTINKEWRNA